MIRQQPVIHNQKEIGVLLIADWGVTFAPADNSSFHEARLKTWETVEAAKSEVLRAVNWEGAQYE